MSKYDKLTKRDGNSKWFLQKTIKEHDNSMDHPWMQMIYNQSFEIKQYCVWLALQHAAFEALEELVANPAPCCDPKLARKSCIEVDLNQLLGDSWRAEVDLRVKESAATQRYLEHLKADANSGTHMVMAHHFLQYNAVLSGGAYLGKMVQERLCVVHGAPGVRFYAFEDVDAGKESARVQRYLREFDQIDYSDEEREQMRVAMIRLYEDTEAMMTEVYELNPKQGIAYGAAKDGVNGGQKPTPIPEAELLTLTLAELHGFTGSNGSRILMAISGELLDVSAGREMYGPGGSYSILAGRDVTRCLGTMSLEPSALDDLKWEPDCAEDEATLKNWREKLKEKYPVAGSLNGKGSESLEVAAGLRQRGVPGSGAVASTSPVVFTVELDKSSSSKMGFDLDTESLEIKAVSPGGLVATWNSSCPDDQRINAGDTIVGLNGKTEAKEILAELGKPQVLKLMLSRPEASAPNAASSSTAEGDTQKCPISGKEGAACPMSMFGIDVTKNKPKAKAAPSANSNAGAGFMKGKSMIAAVEKETDSKWEDSFLYRICPIHWDLATIKVIIVVAALSWGSGFGFGWTIRRIVYG